MLNSAVSQGVSVSIVNDQAVEFNEVFTLVLTSADRGAVISSTTASITIIDDDGKFIM